MTLVAAVLVVGLLVGAGVGYYMTPSGTGETITDTIEVEVAPLGGKTVQLGYIASTTTALETTPPLVIDIMQSDYNDYVKKLGYDMEFEYLIDCADGQAAIHLEKVQAFKSMDVNIFIGGGWSSQASAALSYCTDNDMLMWSSSSTSPLLALAGDNLFRMCPTDVIQAPAIAEMLWSHGIKAIVIMYRADPWADGIYNFLVPAFEAKGGVVLENIRYAGEATEFANYLLTADNVIEEAIEEYGIEHVGFEIISFAEFVVYATQAKDFPSVYSVTWFGSDGTTLSQQLCDDAPEPAVHLKIHSTYAAPAETKKFTDLYDRYFSMVSQPFGYYSACAYDIGWILTETITAAQSESAMDVIPLQATAAFNSFGSSGWNALDEYDDRFGSAYQIWSYKYDGDVVKPYVSGLYQDTTGEVTWYTDAMGYTPVGP